MNKTGLSLDEIMAMVTDIAKDPESGADRFRALKMLASTNTAAAVLPEPMEQGEIIERLSRLMKASGRDISQAAYQKAFPRHATKAYTAPRFSMDDIPPDVAAKLDKIRNLRSLYKYYPEVKRPGFPPGYPLKRGLGVIAEWCRRVAAQCELDRMQVAANKIEIEEHARDTGIRQDDPPTTPQPPKPTPAPFEPSVIDQERLDEIAEELE